ncbi:hypothetical protein ACBI99_44865 [Nonomuraea sp. ATR24]|uniref:hypothetical protein n=1 Tax=Nonomuraea sp. ATR24 TaxID=1676744 RepID=UPI0035BEF9A8
MADVLAALVPVLIFLTAGVFGAWGERRWLEDEHVAAMIAFAFALGLMVIALWSAALALMT